MMKRFMLFLMIFHLLSCNDSSFQGESDKTIPRVIPTADVTAQTDQTQSSLFNYGSPDQPIDYIFMIDNSVSMNSILNLVQQGFSSALADDVFPSNSRVGVMTTMIADPNNFALPHPLLNIYEGMNLEPGFLDLVNQDSIKNYRDLVPGQAAKWPLDGCQNKWFKPNEVNAAGTPCLVAATQSTFSALGGEAGITAYEQFILKNVDQAVFRSNAIVNIIFVSDTHDPGFNRQELIDNRKSFEQLDQMTRIGNNIAGLKFHAMAPATMCSGENLFDLSYYTLVDAAKGQKADSCITTDYTAFIKQMVESSTVAEPKFDLGVEIQQVTRVLIDGQETQEFELLDDKRTIVIPSLDPKTPVTIEVIFS